MSLNSESSTPITGKADTYEKLLSDFKRVFDGYESILWQYAHGVSKLPPERLEYLLSVELLFVLKPEVLADLELFVAHIIEEQQSELKVAA